MIDRNSVKCRRDLYITMGKARLNAAQEYLKEHADEWCDKHEEKWLGMVQGAEHMLIKACAMNEILND